MNTKAQSTGFSWIYGIVILFGLGILYIVFNQVFIGYLVPTITGQVNNSVQMGMMTVEQQTEITAGINKYMDVFHIVPFVIFFVVVIWMIVVAIRKEKESDVM